MFDLSVRPISSLTTELGVTYNQSQMENKEHKQEDSHEKKEIFLSVLGLRSLTHDKKVGESFTQSLFSKNHAACKKKKKASTISCIN